VNWAPGAEARFYGCNTGRNFSQAFANAQGVPSYGQPNYAYFSGSPAMLTEIAPRGPVYMISAPRGATYWMGTVYADPMVRSTPGGDDE
jgi:hypothetical protein